MVNVMKILITLAYILTAKLLFALEHTINFMWLYDKPRLEERFIFPEVRKKASPSWDIKVIDDWLIHWLRENPKGKFVFWYDQNTVNDQQIENTLNEFNILKNKYLEKNGTLEIKNIHDLDLIQSNPQLSSTSIPIYLRADLIRIAAAIEYIKRCTKECAFMYVDIDKGLKIDNGKFINANISEKDIFSENIIDGLKKNGIILNKGYENSFFILSNHNKNMIEAIEITVIDSNLYRFKNLPYRIEQLKSKMEKNLVLDKEVNNFVDEIVNRVFNTMGTPLINYYHHLNQDIELIPQNEHIKSISKNMTPEDFVHILGNLNNVYNSGFKKAFHIKPKNETVKPEITEIICLNMEGSPTISTNESNIIDKLFGANFYNSWKNRYNISDEQGFHRDIINYLKEHKYISNEIKFDTYIPQSSKAEKILFFKDKDNNDKVIKIFKDIKEYEKETALIARHNQLIDDITKINKSNLEIPVFIKSEASFTIGKKGLILMPKANGYTLTEIIDNLAKFDIDELENMFEKLGKSRGNLDALYALTKNKIIYSDDQHGDNVFIDKNYISYIDLELYEAEPSKFGLLNDLDKVNYFFDIIRRSTINKYASMPYDQGLKKYFVMLTSFIGNYLQALKDNLPEDKFTQLTTKQNEALKTKLITISEMAIDKFMSYKKKEKKSKISFQPYLNQLHDEPQKTMKNFLNKILEELINIDDQRKLLLHENINNNNLDIIPSLIEKMSEEEINQQDDTGHTALHLVVDLEQEETRLVEILLQKMNINGINAKNNYGKTALDWAKRSNHKETIDLINKKIIELSK